MAKSKTNCKKNQHRIDENETAIYIGIQIRPCFSIFKPIEK